MEYVLYKITNLLNNKIYIGIHKTNNDNDGYMGSGKLIKFAIKKYGIVNFKKEIIHRFTSLDEARAKEKEIVDEEYILSNNTYNISIGGGLGSKEINGLSFASRKHSEETKQKIRLARIGKSYLTEEGLSNIIHFNKTNEDRKKKISNALKNRPSNNIKGINGSNYGKECKRGYKRKYKQMWINDGAKSTRIKCDDSIPQGWKKGRIVYSGIV